MASHELLSNRGRPKTVHEGFAFVYDKQSKDGKTDFWRCEKKGDGCKARLHTLVSDGSFVKLLNDHNHGSQAAEIQAKLIQNKIKKRAINTTESTGQVLSNALVGMSQAVASVLPSVGAMKKQIQRVRRKENKAPANPASLDDLVIPVEYTRIGDELFLLGDSYSGNFRFKKASKVPRILIFGKESYRVWSGQMKAIFCDGSFRQAAQLFKQIYVILAKRTVTHGNDFIFPVMYACLPDKKESTYSFMFEMIKQIWPEFDPDSISIDYEKAVMNSVEKHFPESAIHGCLFHLMKNLRHCLSVNKILGQFNTDPDFALNCRTVTALAFVPIDDLEAAFNAISAHLTGLSDEYKPILGWFEKYYIGKKKRNQQNRSHPTFPPVMWSCYQRTIDGEARTNNNAEAAHRRLQSDFPFDHPTIWALIDALKKSYGSQDVTMEQCVAGSQPPKKRFKYRQVDDRLLNLVESYDLKSDFVEYLRGIAQNIKME